MNKRLTCTSYDDGLAFAAPGNIDGGRGNTVELRKRALDGLPVDVCTVHLPFESKKRLSPFLLGTNDGRCSELADQKIFV